MSLQVATVFVQQYSSAVLLLLRQSESRFEAAVQVRPFFGKAASVLEQFGPTNATRVTSRHADTALSSTPHTERWAFPLDCCWADMTDEPDLAETGRKAISLFKKSSAFRRRRRKRGAKPPLRRWSWMI